MCTPKHDAPATRSRLARNPPASRRSHGSGARYLRTAVVNPVSLTLLLVWTVLWSTAAHWVLMPAGVLLAIFVLIAISRLELFRRHVDEAIEQERRAEEEKAR